MRKVSSNKVMKKQVTHALNYHPRQPYGWNHSVRFFVVCYLTKANNFIETIIFQFSFSPADFQLFPYPPLPDPDRATLDDAPPIDGGGDRGGEVDDRGAEVEGRGGDRLPRH